MTDRETLIALLEKMGLKRVDRSPWPAANEYALDGDEVIVGAGRGYGSFYARFTFDADGNIQTHALLE